MEVTHEVAKAQNLTRSTANLPFLPTTALLFWLPEAPPFCPGSAGPHALPSGRLPIKLPRFPLPDLEYSGGIGHEMFRRGLPTFHTCLQGTARHRLSLSRQNHRGYPLWPHLPGQKNQFRRGLRRTSRWHQRNSRRDPILRVSCLCGHSPYGEPEPSEPYSQRGKSAPSTRFAPSRCAIYLKPKTWLMAWGPAVSGLFSVTTPAPVTGARLSCSCWPNGVL